MWELDCEEGWASKNWCFWTVVLEKTLQSPLDCKTLESPLDCKIKPVSPKGNQSWIITEGLMLKLKLQYSGHLMWRTDSLKKTLMLGKTESRRRGRQGTEDEMVGWQHWLMDRSLSKLRELAMDREAWHAALHGAQRVGHNWATELNWTRMQKSQAKHTDVYMSCQSSALEPSSG